MIEAPTVQETASPRLKALRTSRFQDPLLTQPVKITPIAIFV